MSFLNFSTNNWKLLLCATFSLSLTSLFYNPVAINAQPAMDDGKCEYFKEVTTDKTEIRKQIQDTLVRRNNWNTDFAIPTGKKYDFFVGKMTPENTASYDISIHLKYPNGTSDTVYSRNVQMERGEGYSLTFQTPTANQPYQVNVRVGGANNNAYNISILGCQ